MVLASSTRTVMAQSNSFVIIVVAFVLDQRHMEHGSGMEPDAVSFRMTEYCFIWFFAILLKLYLVLCPLGWLNYEIYCYYPSSSAATWANARVYCQLYGADLLVIKTQAEFDFIEPYAATIIGSYGHALIGYYTNVTTRRMYNYYKATSQISIACFFKLVYSVGLIHQCLHSLVLEWLHQEQVDRGGVVVNRISYLLVIHQGFKPVGL